ncbi:MAG TPA: hypothetical protein VLJ39_04750 [Tepidisphaeraceae bacterium]|nr:hypothetical protein [Tepidisphaeraceae bacterium]
MNTRTQNVIVWDGFPHPDPVMPNASVCVEIAPPFWRRLSHHLNGVQSAAWDAWLTPGGTAALREALECDVAQVTGAAPRARTNPWPVDVVERLRATLCASFFQPLAMWVSTPGITGGGYYQMILTSGAIAVFRSRPADPTRLLLEDCFFTSQIDPTGKSGDDMFRRPMVETMVRRYGRFDAAEDRFRLTDTRPIIDGEHRVRFLSPEHWEIGHSDWAQSRQSKRAESVGMSRLFANHGGHRDDKHLTKEAAVIAARELKPELEALARTAARLPLLFHSASEAYREEVCLDLLERRFSAWATYIAIDEAYTTALLSEDVDAGFGNAMDAVLAGLESLDEAMQLAEPYWSSVVAQLPLINNWLNRLAAEYREALPWWMTSALQQTATSSAHSCPG